MKYYLYTLREPTGDKIIRYVGQTKNPKQRYNAHIRDAFKSKKTAPTKKQLWIRNLDKKGLKPIMKIEGVKFDEVAAREEEHRLVIENINTIYNIHLPEKGAKTVEYYKRTGKTKEDKK